MKNKEGVFKIKVIKALTLITTFVMLAFAFQYTIIDLINLDDTLTQNILQNPISEEEEEEKVDDAKDCQFYQVPYQLNLFVGNEKANSYFKSNSFCYKNSFIKTLNQPPEHNL